MDVWKFRNAETTWISWSSFTFVIRVACKYKHATDSEDSTVELTQIFLITFFGLVLE